MKKIILTVALISIAASAMCADLKDRQSDTWAATDALGRVLPMSGEVRERRDDKFVGMFYFLWLGHHFNNAIGPHDVSKILKEDPDAMSKPDSPLWGPKNAFHYWSEPYFGYYSSMDKWVYRKHAEMLTDLGVDTVIFDTTNGYTYTEEYMTLCEVWSRMRKEGMNTPCIAFLTRFVGVVDEVNKIWDEFYGKGLYKELWFMWKGKPLILTNEPELPQKYKDFFTVRCCEPSYFIGPAHERVWGWLQVYPQHEFVGDDMNKCEEMTVGIGQNGANGLCCAFSEPGTHGRSYHNGTTDTRPGAVNYGYNFAEQWERALKADPDFVFITGWNEWIAMRLDSFPNSKGPVQFVDCYTQEKSRDIEPMKGGHGDNYYYQTADYIRRYKGARPAPGKKFATVKKMADWDKIPAEYFDSIGDTAHRNEKGVQLAPVYVNETGRNDFECCKVAHDKKNIYFYVQTKDAIKDMADPGSMVLLIDTDGDMTNGFHGYDLIVNRTFEGKKCDLRDGSGKVLGKVKCEAAGNRFFVTVPRKIPGKNNDFSLRFKWSDNMQDKSDAMDFISNGDAAPNGRFAYVY